MSNVKSGQLPSRTAEDFFDHEYLDFAHYTIENRAIPSCIDGFKPTQRKAACAANKYWRAGNEKPLKVFQLSGIVASTMFYHHGSSSLDSAIIAMAQTFKNSMPIFLGIGQFGSLRSPEPGAARYVSVKFNDNFKLLYKDFELVKSQIEEGEEIEPKFFLPIIPTVLLNGGSGIAVGFATNILNRHPADLIDACLDILSGKQLRKITPWIRGFYGTFVQSLDSPRSWLIKGKYEVKNTSTVEITEIPPSFTYEKYENHLNNLVEKGIITSYDDLSADRVNYVLKIPRQKLAELISKKKLDDVLKMQEKDTENITTLDETGKLRVFETVDGLIQYFVNFRLIYYAKRYERLLIELQDELELFTSRAKFIKMIIDEEIKVGGIKKLDVEKQLDEFKFARREKSFDYLLSMPIHTLTNEKYDEIIKKMSTKQDEFAKIQSTTPKDMYIDDLRQLRKTLKGVDYERNEC